MKILVISDIHGDVSFLEKLSDQFAESDFVLFAGDFAAFSHPETAQIVLDALSRVQTRVFSVLGNCDEPSFLSEIEKAGINTQGKAVFFKGFTIAGSGGGSKFTGTTPYERSEEDMVGDFTAVENLKEEKQTNLILISHNPPKDTECDKVSSGAHVGSSLLRSFIEKHQPILTVTGHIHESAGISKIGDCVVVNPGSLAEGKYAIAELKQNAQNVWNVEKVELCALS